MWQTTVRLVKVSTKQSTALSDANPACNVVLPGTLRPAEIAVWLAGFTQHPVLLHSLSYNAEVHRTLSSNTASAERERRILIHKGRTINAVNRALSNVDQLRNDEVEALVVAVFLLWRANPGSSPQPEREFLLFRPYIPGLSWVNLYSKADAIDAHARALLWLLGRIGGIDKVQLPGLRLVLAT
jgi:hypothetical protein